MAHARILVVEDEIELMRATSKCLQSAGHEVIPACDGMTATKLAMDERPDLILLDIALPAGDGHTVAERLRSNVKTMSIPIVYMTSHKSEEHRRKAKELGAVGYVVKPCRPETLLGVVSQVIRKHSVASPAIA